MVVLLKIKYPNWILKSIYFYSKDILGYLSNVYMHPGKCKCNKWIIAKWNRIHYSSLIMMLFFMYFHFMFLINYVITSLFMFVLDFHIIFIINYIITYLNLFFINISFFISMALKSWIYYKITRQIYLENLLNLILNLRRIYREYPAKLRYKRHNYPLNSCRNYL